MEPTSILSIVLSVVTVIVVIMSYYFAVRKRLETNAQQAINNAEETKKKGKEKMKMAVQEVRDLIPKAIRPFFSDDNIEKIVQQVFDGMEHYAKWQIKKKGR